MIDIVKAVQEADPSLGTYVVVLRTDARALDGPERFTPEAQAWICLLYTSPSPRDATLSRMPSSA